MVVTFGETLISVWQQTLVEAKREIQLDKERHRVKETRGKKLRTVGFAYGTYQIDGIEQNPRTGSRWAMLAREGNRVMQFTCEGRYIANVCEGKLLRYPGWHELELPE
jgi:hypothetical protein